jgi:hypothetical protein
MMNICALSSYLFLHSVPIFPCSSSISSSNVFDFAIIFDHLISLYENIPSLIFLLSLFPSSGSFASFFEIHWKGLPVFLYPSSKIFYKYLTGNPPLLQIILPFLQDAWETSRVPCQLVWLVQKHTESYSWRFYFGFVKIL